MYTFAKSYLIILKADNSTSIPMTDKCNTSGFVPPEDIYISNVFVDIQEIPSEGFSMLLRAKRDGQWWMLKGLKTEYRNDFVYQELLHKEHNILNGLKSHYIVDVCGMENIEGYGECIIMEWVDGLTLRQWLTLKHSCREKRRIFSQLLDAVEFVHQRQVVHRDLKPENVMVTRNGQNVKLIDFGLADTDSYAVFKQPAGSVGFIAPEQSNGSVPDSRNDIYSLGCILQLMDISWIYRRVINSCHAPINKRFEDVASMRNALRSVRHRLHVACIVLLLVFVSGGVSYAYHELAGPRQTYNIVADFKIGYLRFQSWGGGQVTVASTDDVDSCVEIPPHVEYQGIKYNVTEVTFKAFSNHRNLRCVVFPDNMLHVMKGAFKGCPSLDALCLRSKTPYAIGNDMWKTDITKIFDSSHFQSVTLYVPRGSIQAYRHSEWGKFKNIKEYV